MNKSVVIHENELKGVLELLGRLEAAKIHFTLARNQEDAITVEVAVPGQRWEIDCYSNGMLQVEIFKSDGSIRDASAIDELFQDFSD
ncbi:MAG TPA: hypothetical protein VNH11_01835 [Pirellulales bacterium]|nr:hypothetical protein [Pirellulales bacterium]